MLRMPPVYKTSSPREVFNSIREVTSHLNNVRDHDHDDDSFVKGMKGWRDSFHLFITFVLFLYQDMSFIPFSSPSFSSMKTQKLAPSPCLSRPLERVTSLVPTMKQEVGTMKHFVSIVAKTNTDWGNYLKYKYTQFSIWPSPPPLAIDISLHFEQVMVNSAHVYWTLRISPNRENSNSQNSTWIMANMLVVYGQPDEGHIDHNRALKQTCCVGAKLMQPSWSLYTRASH